MEALGSIRMSDLLDSIEVTMASDRRSVAWTLRRAEGERLAQLINYRRHVWVDYGDDAADRAQELDYLIARSEALITLYGEQCCERPVVKAPAGPI